MKRFKDLLIEMTKEPKKRDDTQSYRADIEEASTVLHLLDHIEENHKKENRQMTKEDLDFHNESKEHATSKLKSSLDNLTAKKGGLEAGEIAKSKGVLAAKAVIEHHQKENPNTKIVRVRLSTKNGDISKATRGQHNDTNTQNNADFVVGRRNHSDGHHGSITYTGYSAKTSLKGKNDGLLNPTPRRHDKFFKDTKISRMWKSAKSQRDALVSIFHPGFSKLPNNSKSGKKSKKDVISNLSVHGLQTMLSKLQDSHHNRIRDRIVKKFNAHSDRQAVKEHFSKYFGGPTMSVHKIETKGSSSDKIKAKIIADPYSEHKRMLSHPESVITLHPSGTGGFIVRAKLGNKTMDLIREQVKTSSGFGYSGPRHNAFSASKVHEDFSNLPFNYFKKCLLEKYKRV